MNTEKEEIKELKRKIQSLQNQLEIERNRAKSLSGGSLLNSEEIDLYPGEQLDFILSILEQAKSRCPEGSRPYDILQSLLSVNTPVGNGAVILSTLGKIFRNGEPTKESDISKLDSLGFTYTPSRKHPKLKFHDKYMFILPNTSSDKRRSGLNCLSEINKCIAVSQKI